MCSIVTLRATAYNSFIYYRFFIWHYYFFRETRGRSRGTGLGVPGMAGVLARMAAHRKGETPPPPYDSPPPYHVAIKMGAVPDIVVSDPIVI